VKPRTVIRAATAADLDSLVRLLGLLFSIEADFRPNPPRQRHGLLLMIEEPERRVVLVADRAGAIIGMVTVQLVVSTAEGAPSAWVEDMVVDEKARGGGVGRRLLQAAERWARGRGATRFQLLADRANRPAHRFYRRMGWCGTQLVCLRRGGVPARATRARGRAAPRK
jgi:GNAT superfamily N-acetyltransferase